MRHSGGTRDSVEKTGGREPREKSNSHVSRQREAHARVIKAFEVEVAAKEELIAKLCGEIIGHTSWCITSSWGHGMGRGNHLGMALLGAWPRTCAVTTRHRELECIYTFRCREIDIISQITHLATILIPPDPLGTNRRPIRLEIQ